MLTITTGNRPMTVINVFTVAPTQQARLVELLTQATESSIRARADKESIAVRAA
jgi:hypothetical protein